MWGGNGGTDAILENRYYLPSSRRSEWAPAWAAWFLDPEDPIAQEPPDVVKEQFGLLREMRAAASPDEQNRLMAEILEIAQEQFWVMGIHAADSGSGHHDGPDAQRARRHAARLPLPHPGTHESGAVLDRRGLSGR